MSSWLLLLLVFLAGLFLAIGLAGLVQGLVSRWLGQEQGSSEQALSSLGVEGVSAAQVVTATLVGAFLILVLVWWTTSSLLVGLVAAVAMLFAPRLVFAHLRNTRRIKIDEQLPTALDRLAASARNLSIAQAFEEVQKTTTDPIAHEFALIVRDYRMGSDLKSAIQEAKRRIDTKSFRLVASALEVNLDKGGNLVETLERISLALKEIWRLEQKAITASAEARKGVRVMSAMPVLIFIMVAAMQPDLITTLTSNWIGWVCIVVAGTMYVLALLWFRRILRIEV